MKNFTQKPASLFPDNDETVLLRHPNKPSKDPKCFQQVATELKNYLTEFSTD